MIESLYETLGVTPGASGTQIRNAYFRACKVHHPDKGGDPAKFRKIAFAYEILGNSSKRDEYDKNGAADFEARQSEIEKSISDVVGMLAVQLEERNFDLIAEARRHVAAKRQSFLEQAAIADAERQRFLKLKRRVTCKDGIRNVVFEYFESREKSFEMAVSRNQDYAQLAVDVLAHLENFTDRGYSNCYQWADLMLQNGVFRP